MTQTIPSDPKLLVTEDGRYEPYDFWLTTCGLYTCYDYALDLLGDLDDQHILDCGCGAGHTSIMFTRRGATVQGFDIDANELRKAKALAEANGVQIDYARQRFEEIDYPDASFDMAFGSCVIHHVDVEKAVAQLGRVLKPAGRAVFIENSNRNRLLMFARNRIVGIFGVPKYGDDDEEHPLRGDEIKSMRAHFPGEIRLHWPTLVLFRLADFYLFRGRSEFLSRLMRGLDAVIGSVPYLRRFGYFQIIEFKKDG